MGERVGGPGDGIKEGQIQEIILKGRRAGWWQRNISRPFDRNIGTPINNFFSGLFSGAKDRISQIASKAGSIMNTSPFEKNSKGETVSNSGFTAESAMKVAGTYSTVVYIGLDESDPTGVTSVSRLASSQVSNGSTQDYYNTINNFTGGDAGIKGDAIAAALIFIPEEGFLTKGLKGVGEFGMCKNFAKSFLKKYGGEKIIIDIGKGGILGTTKAQLSNNGYHEVILKTIDGTEYIFDNFHSKGILKSDYVKEINGFIKGKTLTGEEIFQHYTK